jgi:hypothetical protein
MSHSYDPEGIMQNDITSISDAIDTSVVPALNRIADSLEKLVLASDFTATFDKGWRACYEAHKTYMDTYNREKDE